MGSEFRALKTPGGRHSRNTDRQETAAACSRRGGRSTCCLHRLPYRSKTSRSMRPTRSHKNEEDANVDAASRARVLQVERLLPTMGERPKRSRKKLRNERRASNRDSSDRPLSLSIAPEWRSSTSPRFRP